MSQQQEVIFDTIGFPITSRFAVVLLLDYQLLQSESSIYKELHNIKAHGNDTALFARVTH